jgi:hypothetical protein
MSTRRRLGRAQLLTGPLLAMLVIESVVSKLLAAA